MGLDLGEADLEAVPAAPGSKGTSFLRARLSARSLGPLTDVLRAKGDLTLSISGKPPEPLERYFNEAAKRLQHAIAQAKGDKHAERALDEMVRETLASFEKQIPRLLLEAEVDLRLPDALRGIVEAEGNFRLLVCSPGSGPADDTPVGRVRRFGGAAVHGKLGFDAFGFKLQDVIEAELEPEPHGRAPRIRGLWQRQEMTPDGVKLTGVRATFDTRPDPGGATLSLSGTLELPDFELGPFVAGSFKAEPLRLADPVLVEFALSLAADGRFHGHAAAEAQHQGFVLRAPALELWARPDSPRKLADELRRAIRREFEKQFRPQALGSLVSDAAKKAREEAKQAVEQELSDIRSGAQHAKDEIDGIERSAQHMSDEVAGKLQEVTNLRDHVRGASDNVERKVDEVRRKLDEANDLVSRIPRF
jgi:hypothetical protein